MDFKGIIGHEDIIGHFKSSIEMDKVSHAYIIGGETDCGKKLLANAFAKTLQCEKGEVDCCNECKSCVQCDSGNNPDIIVVSHEKPNLISVDEIRKQLVETIEIKPYRGRYKVYIIPEAQLMNEQAQNALLKSIEEPPAYAVILLLTTNVNRMLDTVLSRCIVLNTKPIRDIDIIDYLKLNMHIDEEKARFCLDFSQGNMGKAIKLAKNDEYSQIVESVVQELSHIFVLDVDTLKAAMARIKMFRISIDDYMDLMMMWYRDVLMLKVTGKIDKLLFKDQYSIIKKQASVLSYKSIEDKLNAITKAKQRIDANADFDTIIELLLLTLKET